MIDGFNHVTFSVRDLDRSFRFYRDVLGLRPLARWDRGAYLLGGDTAWVCLTLDERRRPKPLPEYTHTAFSASSEALNDLRQRLAKHDAEIWQENTSEGDSVYVLDPDGHKLEIHVGDWRTRLEALRAESRSGMQLF